MEMEGVKTIAFSVLLLLALTVRPGLCTAEAKPKPAVVVTAPPNGEDDGAERENTESINCVINPLISVGSQTIEKLGSDIKSLLMAVSMLGNVLCAYTITIATKA